MSKKRRKRFEDLLKSRKITAYRVAKILKYKDVTTVYRWIYGQGEPTAATMLKLMEILDVSALEILQVFADIKED